MTERKLITPERKIEVKVEHDLGCGFYVVIAMLIILIMAAGKIEINIGSTINVPAGTGAECKFADLKARYETQQMELHKTRKAVSELQQEKEKYNRNFRQIEEICNWNFRQIEEKCNRNFRQIEEICNQNFQNMRQIIPNK